jgi:phage-related protein
MIFTLWFGNYEFPNQTFEIDGLPVENNVQESIIPRRHGVIIQAPYLKSRTFKISGILHNNTAETSHTQLMAMQAALLAGENNFKYRSDRQIKCYTKSIKPEFKEGTDKAVIEVAISLVAQEPFFCSAGASYSDIQTPVKGTTLLFDIYNGGNVFSEPKFMICATGGTISDDIQLKNITNGNQLFKFRGVVPNGLTLEIDCGGMAVLNNAVDALSYFEGDFVTLLPGTNSFQFVGATCRLTTEDKYRWY